MRGLSIIITKALLGLLEMSSYDVFKIHYVDHDLGVERVKVVKTDLHCRHVPLVIFGHFCVALDVLRQFISNKSLRVEFGILITQFIIGEKPQRLMHPNSP